MNTKQRETVRWNAATDYSILAVSLGLPFLLQKWNLDATRGGWRPELANFGGYLVLSSLILPIVILACLPLRWQHKLALGAVVAPLFFAAFVYFNIDYACNNYGHTCF